MNNLFLNSKCFVGLPKSNDFGALRLFVAHSIPTITHGINGWTLRGGADSADERHETLCSVFWFTPNGRSLARKCFSSIWLPWINKNFYRLSCFCLGLIGSSHHSSSRQNQNEILSWLSPVLVFESLSWLMPLVRSSDGFFSFWGVIHDSRFKFVLASQPMRLLLLRRAMALQSRVINSCWRRVDMSTASLSSELTIQVNILAVTTNYRKPFLGCVWCCIHWTSKYPV